MPAKTGPNGGATNFAPDLKLDEVIALEQFGLTTKLIATKDELVSSSDELLESSPMKREVVCLNRR